MPSLASGEPPAAPAAPKTDVSELALLVGVATMEVAAGESNKSEGRTGRDGVVGVEKVTGRDFFEALRVMSVERAVEVTLEPFGEALIKALPGDGVRPELGCVLWTMGSFGRRPLKKLAEAAARVGSFDTSPVEPRAREEIVPLS